MSRFYEDVIYTKEKIEELKKVHAKSTQVNSWYAHPLEEGNIRGPWNRWIEVSKNEGCEHVAPHKDEVNFIAEALNHFPHLLKRITVLEDSIDLLKDHQKNNCHWKSVALRQDDELSKLREENEKLLSRNSELKLAGFQSISAYYELLGGKEKDKINFDFKDAYQKLSRDMPFEVTPDFGAYCKEVKTHSEEIENLREELKEKNKEVVQWMVDATDSNLDCIRLQFENNKLKNELKEKDEQLNVKNSIVSVAVANIGDDLRLQIHKLKNELKAERETVDWALKITGQDGTFVIEIDEDERWGKHAHDTVAKREIVL